MTPTRTSPNPLVWATNTQKLLKLCAIVGALLLAALLLRDAGGQRALLAISLGGLCFMLMVRAPRAGLPLIVIYLALLGGLRRWLIPGFGWVANDPLVLVGPALAFPYFVSLIVSRRLHNDTRLGYLLLWLVGVMALEVLNPFQGGLVVGIAGALFYVVPLLWYHIARDKCSMPTLEAIFKVVIATALLGALYGLYQTWFGFSVGEAAWIKQTMPLFAGLSVGADVRPFSFFSSVAEYVTWLSIAAVVLWAMVLRGNRMALAGFLFLLVTLFLAGSRGSIVMTLAACTLLWAVQGATFRSWLPRGVFAVIFAALGLTWSMQQVQKVDIGGPVQGLVAHQTQGLSNPTDPTKSTAGVHTNLLIDGYLQGFRNPIGLGLGATTMAASKFGGTGNDTEVDISNMFVSLGLLGGPLYLFIFCFTLVVALRYWYFTRSLVALQIIGTLIAVQGHWLSGGMYVIVMLVWTCIGALDAAQKKIPEMAFRKAETQPEGLTA